MILSRSFLLLWHEKQLVRTVEKLFKFPIVDGIHQSKRATLKTTGNVVF